jgi:hypothetical protein
MPDEEIEMRYYNERTGKEEWRCKHCDRTYACSGGTAAPAKHLTDPPPDGHGLPRGAPRTTKVTTIRTILERARAVAEENPHKRRRLNDQPGDSINPDPLEVLYVRFITACSLPFRLVECPEFRVLLAYINKDVDTWLPNTHETIRKWIMRQYEDQKEKVKQRIQSAKSRIHISCDLWTSPNSLAILGIVAHYVTEDGQLEHHVLALKDIDSEHDGSHLAVAVLNVVDEWGFASKLGYFVMDNAGNNDILMRSLSLGQHNDSLFLLTGGPNILQASYADMTSNTTPKCTDCAAKVISSTSLPKPFFSSPMMRNSKSTILACIM